MGIPRKEKEKQVDTHQKTIKPQFVAVIVSPAKQLLKLRLPKRFGLNHGKHLSNFGYLRVPNGVEWPVEIHKIKRSVWLKRGWTQFAQHNYSISGGSFLVFKYDRDSRFRVNIFDTSLLQIDYKKSGESKLHNVDSFEEDEQMDDDDEQMLDESLQHQSGRSGKDVHRSAEKIHDFEVENVESSDEDDTSIQMLDESLQLQSGESLEESESPRNSPADRALQRAKAFRTQNPSFIAHIRKRNLRFNHGPTIATSHCRTYLKKNGGNNNIILRTKKRAWHVTCRCAKQKFCVSMSFGWREFASDNDLQDGDKIVFELIDVANKTYYAHLFHFEIKDDISTETPGSRGKDEKHTIRCSSLRVLEKAEAFLSDSPGFVLRISKCYAESKRAVHIPQVHSRKYLKDEGSDLNAIVIHGKGDKSWEVKYRIEDSHPRLSVGWKKFCLENHLEKDDVCVFKLSTRKRKTYRVTIFRGNAE